MNIFSKFQISKKVQGVSPIFHPDFVKVFYKLLDDGANVKTNIY
jgi:predicted transcriptional regulator